MLWPHSLLPHFSRTSQRFQLFFSPNEHNSKIWIDDFWIINCIYYFMIDDDLQNLSKIVFVELREVVRQNLQASSAYNINWSVRKKLLQDVGGFIASGFFCLLLFILFFCDVSEKLCVRFFWKWVLDWWEKSRPRLGNGNLENTRKTEWNEQSSDQDSTYCRHPIWRQMFWIGSMHVSWHWFLRENIWEKLVCAQNESIHFFAGLMPTTEREDSTLLCFHPSFQIQVSKSDFQFSTSPLLFVLPKPDFSFPPSFLEGGKGGFAPFFEDIQGPTVLFLNLYLEENVKLECVNMFLQTLSNCDLSECVDVN